MAKSKKGTESDVDHGGGSSTVCSVLWKLLAIIPLIAALVLYLGPTMVSEWEGFFGYGHVPSYDVSPSVLHQFRLFDVNGDGFLDPYEFERLSQQFVLGVHKDFHSQEQFPVYSFEDTYMSSGQEVVVVRAEMTPIVLETMTKFDDQEQLHFGSPETLLPGLFSWKEPHESLHAYGALNFRSFLPPMEEWPLATPYFIVHQHADETQTHMNRYYPQPPPLNHALLHSLLAQLHPNIFLVTRFGPRGTMALVRAKSEHMFDIVIRVHAEFQLNSEPSYPFWYTPAQFAGRLLLNKTSEHVEHFELYLPTDKQLNIDMEWSTGPDSNEVDIGFMPLLRVVSTQPSFAWEPDKEKPVVDAPFNDSKYTWDEEIPLEEAKAILERAFYPFKKVTYFPFLEAFQRAITESSGRTLRDGPLACPPVLTLLNSSYVSTWMLVKDLEDIVADSKMSSHDKQLAQSALDSYKFPVQSMVIEPNEGRVLQGLNANELMDTKDDTHLVDAFMSDPINRRYSNFLKEGLASL